MYEIFTVCNDKMAINLAALIASIRTHVTDTAIKIIVIPFDNQIALMKKICYILDAELIKPMKIWDNLGQTIFKEEEYRSGVSSWRYFRKLNALTIAKNKYIFLDANTLILNKLQPVFAALDQYDFIFGRYAIKGRNFNEWSQAILNVANQEISSGFNAGFWASHAGLIAPREYLKIAQFTQFREFLTKSPEQSFLSFIIALKKYRVITLGRALTTAADLLPGRSSNIYFADDKYWHRLKNGTEQEAIAIKWSGSYLHKKLSMPNIDIYKKYIDIAINTIQKQDQLLANELTERARALEQQTA